MARMVWLLHGVCILLVLIAGCSKRNARDIILVPVQGTVTWQGKPVENATVVFCPKTPNAKAAVGKTDQQGQFWLTTFEQGDGAVAGTYAVTVTKTRIEGGMTPDEATAYFMREGRNPPSPKITQLLPTQYGDMAHSGLSATVTAGETNDYRFDLR